MKKLLLKTFMVSVVFFGTGFLLYFFVIARNGLQVNPGDKLLSSKWNELVGNVVGNTTKITSVESKFTGENRIDATLQNSWVRYDSSRPMASYYKDSFGNVYLRGLVKGGTEGTVVFTLPTGYRPLVRKMFSVEARSLTTYKNTARVDVNPAGQVVLTVGTGNGYLSLDGIVFRTY